MRLPPGCRSADRGRSTFDDVEEHAERALRRRERVQPVPRHRAGLARGDRHHDRRAVRDRLERAARLVRQVDGDACGVEGLGGEDDLARELDALDAVLG